jgi:hypothetical protein
LLELRRQRSDGSLVGRRERLHAAQQNDHT